MKKLTDRATRNDEESAAASSPLLREAFNADGAWQTRCAERVGDICCRWPSELPPATATNAMAAATVTEEPVCQCLYGHLSPRSHFPLRWYLQSILAFCSGVRGSGEGVLERALPLPLPLSLRFLRKPSGSGVVHFMCL